MTEQLKPCWVPDDDELEYPDNYIGLPYVSASEPTIEPGKSDAAEVAIRLPGGGSVTHALGAGHDADELSRRIAAVIRSIIRSMDNE